MKKTFEIKIYLLIFLSVLSISSQAAANPIGFDDLPALVKNQNLKVKGAGAFVKSAEAQTGHLQRSFLPTVKGYGGVESFKTLTESTKTEPIAGVQANINLLRGGKDIVEERLREKNLEIENTQALKNYLIELKRARDIFVHLLYLKEVKATYRNSLYRNRKNIDLVKQRIEAGRTTETDKVDFEIEQSRLRQELAILNEDFEHALELLQVILGLSLDEKIRLKGKLDHKHHDPIFKVSFSPQTHYEVAMLDQRVDALRLQKKQANLWWTPKVDLYGSYNLHSFRERERTAIEQRDELVAGVQLSLNLFDGLYAQSQAKAFKHQAQGMELTLQQKKRELEVLFRKLKHILKLRHDLVHRVRKSVRQTGRYVELTREEYERGTKNSPDLLNATQRLQDQKTRYSKIRKDFLMTKNELLTFLGQ